MNQVTLLQRLRDGHYKESGHHLAHEGDVGDDVSSSSQLQPLVGSYESDLFTTSLTSKSS